MAQPGRRTGTPTMGASIEKMGSDTWRIRWGQIEDGKRSGKQTTIHGSRTEAEAYRAQVVSDVRTKGYHGPAEYRAKHAPPANLMRGLRAWLNAAETDGTPLPGEDAGKGGLAPSTVYRYQGRILALLAAIHEAEAIPETHPLPVTLLDRPLFLKLRPILAKRGATVPSQSLQLLWDAWAWLSKDPKTWPQTPAWPGDARGFVPPGRSYGRTVAPTLDHTNAMLRRLAMMQVRRDAVAVVISMRYTGLRVSQVLGIRREDIDLTSGMLLVRKGKSKREKGEKRIIPVSRHLLAEPLVRTAIDRAQPGERVFRTEGSQFVAQAWMAATEAGEVPLHTWRPANRARARPNHAFRAALIAHLTGQRTPPDVISLLVGHAHADRNPSDASAKVQETHYGRSLEEIAREVVDALPPIDWTRPDLPEGVVPFLAEAERLEGRG